MEMKLKIIDGGSDLVTSGNRLEKLIHRIGVKKLYRVNTKDKVVNLVNLLDWEKQSTEFLKKIKG
jgi:hypothetical protein